MNCKDCGAEIISYYNVLLCDRCLKAACWENLENDEYIMVRRNTRGRLSLETKGQFTNIGYLFGDRASAYATEQIASFILQKPFSKSLL